MIYWYAITKNWKLRPIPGEPEKYKPFQRPDASSWHYHTAFIALWFHIPRLVVGWGLFLFATVYVALVTLGHKKGTPYKQWQLSAVRNFGIYVISPCVQIIAGLIPFTYRVECDYSKWLGPNYKLRYEGAGVNICNHVSLMDVVQH